MSYNYLALIQGGEGPDVWDKEKQISAVDFADASGQAVDLAERLGGHVVELSQNDYPQPSKDARITQLEAELVEARKDKERLDYLETQHASLYRFDTGAKLTTWKDSAGKYEKYYVDTSNIRLAIDSAINSTKDNR